MRSSVLLLIASLAGVVGGAALIGLPALGAAIIFDSLCVGIYALFHDDGTGAQPQVHGVPTLGQILERARGAA